MKNKIIGILICALLISTTTFVTVSSNENKKFAYKKTDNLVIQHGKSIEELESNNNFSTLSASFEECIAACLGITLAGNCIYLIVGCAISPGPHNFCCWAAPILCGVDIGLLLSCIAACIDQSADFSEEAPCFPPNIIRIIELIQENNSSGPAIILGLMCLFQRLQQVKEWLKEHGYLSLDIPDIQNCGCNDKP